MSLIKKRNNDGRVSVLNKTQEKINSKLPVQKLPKRRLYRKEKRPKRASCSETKITNNDVIFSHSNNLEVVQNDAVEDYEETTPSKPSFH